MSLVYPMKMKPRFKDYLWGGDKLVTLFGKSTDIRPVAESWEVSAFPSCSSTIENGKLQGKTLEEVIRQHPELIGGKKKLLPFLSGTNDREFPLLIKLIDANQELSLQVHPNDEYAKRVEKQLGKNEMWYIVDCEPDSEIIVGFKEEMSKEEINAAINNNTILDKVNRVQVKKGDCFMIPAGLIHAIGKGILIAEIQQNSNLTYRVYDYNRVGVDGKPRELHVGKALDVIDTTLVAKNTRETYHAKLNGFTSSRLTDWSFFSTNLLCIESHADLNQDDTCFTCALVIEGELTLVSQNNNTTLKVGESMFIPAGFGEYSLRGTAKVLLTTA